MRPHRRSVLSDPSKTQPGLSESVVSLGFPYENISGFPTLHAVPGYITAKTDFFFQRVPWKDSYLIHYCGPVVGGASGSPILNSAGEVIGLISAAENNLSVNGERTSFGFAYGQRVDLARGSHCRTTSRPCKPRATPGGASGSRACCCLRMSCSSRWPRRRRARTASTTSSPASVCCARK